jgi:hypothetical protein
MIHFDHIEVHVSNSEKYVDFLTKLFNGGRAKKIADNNVFMFISSENLRIEVKEVQNNNIINLDDSKIGFCLPCLRMKNAYEHIENLNEVQIVNVLKNPDGDCIFFKDQESITWHIKNYEHFDSFTNF